MKKKIDDLGRIGIPKYIREDMGLNHDPYLCIEYDPDRKTVTLEKAFPTCAVCGTDHNLLSDGGRIFLCKACLQKFHQP